MRRDLRLIRLRALRQVKMQLAGRRLGAAVQTVQALRHTALRIEQLRGEMWLQPCTTDGYAVKATEAARALLGHATDQQQARLISAEARRVGAAGAVQVLQAAVDVVDRALERAQPPVPPRESLSQGHKRR